MAHGIDVSHWQGVIDWEKVAKSKKVDFAIIKATEGSGWRDGRFQANWLGAKAKGLTVGAYHFFRPQYDAEQQAENFYKTLSLVQPENDMRQTVLEPGDLIPWIDVEFLNMDRGVNLADAVQNLAMLVVHLEERFGKPIGIYTAGWAWDPMPHNNRFGHLPLWVATWNNRPGTVAYPESWHTYHVHQYAVGDAGTIPGIAGRIDLNYCPDLARVVKASPVGPLKGELLAALEEAQLKLEALEALIARLEE